MNAGAPLTTAQSAQDHKDISNILKRQAKICVSLFQALDERDALDMKIATLLDKLQALDERGSPIWDRIKHGDGFSPRTKSLNPEALEELRRHRNDPHYATLAKKNSLIFKAEEVADKQARNSEPSAPSLPPKQNPTSPIADTYDQPWSSQVSPSTIVPRTPADVYEGEPRRQSRLRRESRLVGQSTKDTNATVERGYSHNPSILRTSLNPPSTSNASNLFNVSSPPAGRHEEATSAHTPFPSVARSPTNPISFFDHSPRNSESKAATPIVAGFRRRTQSLRSGISQLSSFLNPTGHASKTSSFQFEETSNQASSTPRRNRSSRKI